MELIQTGILAMEEASHVLIINQSGMEPVLQDGDIVYIRLQSEGFTNGDIGIVVEEEQAHVGYIYVNDNQVILVRPHSYLKTFELSETCYILGKVIGFTRTFHNPTQTDNNTQEDESDDGKNGTDLEAAD